MSEKSFFKHFLASLLPFFASFDELLELIYHAIAHFRQHLRPPSERVSIDQGTEQHVKKGSVHAMKLLRPSVITSREWYKERDQDEWRRTKQAVLERDRFACTYCGLVARKFHQVNHIGAEDDHRLENLETVCRACHTVLHKGISSMQGTLTVFECRPDVHNIAPIVCHSRSHGKKDALVGHRAADT